MQKKGQGALEYLLLIGGAVLVAVIVISVISGLGSSGGTESKKQAFDALFIKYPATTTSCTNVLVGSIQVIGPDNVTCYCGPAGTAPSTVCKSRYDPTPVAPLIPTSNCNAPGAGV